MVRHAHALTISSPRPKLATLPTPDIPRASRRLIASLAVSQGALFALLGWARYATFHNETFDLAFYTRIAWGLARNDFWEPMVNAHVYGLHVSVVLAPLGVIGWLTDTRLVLIVAQAAAFALATFPIAQIGARHLGPRGAVLGALLWLLYPNLGHVAGYEVHPGSMAVLPLAYLALALDRGSRRAFLAGVVGALLCREDLALVALAAAALFAWRYREHRRVTAVVSAITLAYALFFFLYLHPTHAPSTGSLQLHFGRFGDTLGEVVLHLLTHPGHLVSHLSTPERLGYLPKILAPLALLPLLRPRWLVPASPLLAVNLVSEWPTTTDLDVHYLTPALPFLVAGALDGAAALVSVLAKHERVPAGAVPLALALAALIGHAIAGGTPLSLDFDGAAYRPDAQSRAARRIVAAVPADASVQAPYALLPHFAERRVLQRTTSPDANAAFYVLDVAHRRAYAGDEDLIRTIEEPPARDWMARSDHRLVLGAGDYLLLQRGFHPRDGVGGRAIVGRVDPEAGQALCACLALLDARIEREELTLRFVARGGCPSDLAIRIGTEERPPRVDLLFAGWLNPVHLERGDLALSRHRLGPAALRAIRADGLRVGAIRQSGARPEPEDPNSIPVPLR